MKLRSVCAFVVLLASVSPAAEKHAKKLIEFGWDEPDTTFMREHITQMQQTPFDGCVFHASYQRTNGTTGSFTWDSWGGETFTEAELAKAFADLRSTRFGRFRENFLRFNTTPAKLDWFDDHAAIMANARLAAKLARAGGCPGILFDIEQYNGPLFNYRKQRDVKNKGWEVYAAQVRQRGSEVMNAFQDGYPGLTVFLTFAYSLPWLESNSGKGSLADCNYGLLAPFVDGMLQSARGKARIVDGHEISYGYKTADQFVAARNKMTREVFPIVREPQKYLQVFSFGFGIWLDQDWRKNGWNTEDSSKNYFSPQALESSVREALRYSDDYVWIYSESPKWWSETGPVKLPAAYDDALRKARKQD